MITTFKFRLTCGAGDAVTVSFSVAGSADDPIDEPFVFDRRRDGRIAEVVARIERDDFGEDDLRDVGSLLWSALICGAIEQRFATLRDDAERAGLVQFQLDLPERARAGATPAPLLHLDELPWEALYDERRTNFLCGSPNYCVTRRPSGNIEPPPRAPVAAHSPLKVLVVVPYGSGLNVQREWEYIEYATARLEDRVKAERLDGEVTPDRLRAKLAEDDWDVVHFIGHSEVDADGQVCIRLNSTDPEEPEAKVGAEQFAANFDMSGSRRAPPRLVVMNSCSGAKTERTGDLTGLAASLLKKSVTAVIAMRFDVFDDAAIDFSRSFYRALFTGGRSGWVEHALATARRHIYLNKNARTVRAFVTPTLCRADPCTRLFDLPADPDDVPVAAPLQSGGAGIEIKKALRDALSQRLCVPVIGPALLAGPALRRGNAPTFDTLINVLAERCAYPARVLQHAAMRLPWTANATLACVCQHFEWTQTRFDLYMEIQQHYKTAEPSPTLMALARWPTPGYLCTHFDGLLHEAVKKTGKAMRVINNLAGAIDSSDDVPLLVHLRGTCADVESLRLTLDDEDALWDDLARLPPPVSRLTGKVGTSLLFVGLSPRDRFVQRLARMLRPLGAKGSQRTSFFICPEDEFDEAYWSRMNFERLADPSDELMAELTQIATRVQP